MGTIAQIQGVRELTAEFESLQNGRWRLTRRVLLQGGGSVGDGTFKSLGSLLSSEYATKADETKFANLVLVKEGAGTDIVNRAQAVVWTGVYETLTGSFVAEVDDRVETVENGLARVTRVLIAAAGTSYAGYVVGTSTYSGLTLAQRVVEENDAYTRVTLVYGAAGVLSRTTTTSNNGALETLVIESANEVPSTPAGYTLVATQVVGELGFETTRYTFVRGVGAIVSRTEETRNNGALSVIGIRYIASAGTVVNPITAPAGYVLASEGTEQQDGYVVWSAEYARGTGEIERQSVTENNGAMLRLSVRYLTAPAAAEPTPSSVSGYVKVSVTKQEASGHTVWSFSYAQGNGEISRQSDTSNNGALLRLAVRYLTAPNASEPTPSSISGYTKISVTKQEADGHLVWSLSYAQGNGEVSRDTNTSNNGALKTITIRHLTAPAAANPISTPSGYVLVSEAVQEADGHRVWSAQYARGNGEISRETQGQGDGVVISIRHLTAPAAGNPISTPIGYLKLSETYQEADGHRVWTAVYAKGDDVTDYDLNGLKRVTRTLFAATGTSTAAFVVGAQTYGSLYLARVRIEDNGLYQRVVAEYLQPGVVSISERTAGEGLKEVTVRSFYTQNAPTGIVTAQTEENENGYPVWVTTVLQSAVGGSPTMGNAVDIEVQVPFTYPGRAKAFVESRTFVAGTAYFFDVFLSPPVEIIVEANRVVEYKTTSTISLPQTLWNPDSWASVIATYVTGGKQYRVRTEGLRGYRAIGSAMSAYNDQIGTFIDGGTGTYAGALAFSILGDNGLASSAGTADGPRLLCVGGPAAPDGNTYTLSYTVEDAFISVSGQKYYKHTYITATIPTQAALPI